jgi:hypothetical protein
VAALVVLDGIRYYHHLLMELLAQLLDIDILLEAADLVEVQAPHHLVRRLLIVVLWADPVVQEGVEPAVM